MLVNGMGKIRLPSRTKILEGACGRKRLSCPREQRRSRSVQCSSRPPKDALQPFTPEGLEQIVECAKLKHGHSIPVVGGGEDYFGLVIKLLQHLQASSTGHHDIEKQQIW